MIVLDIILGIVALSSLGYLIFLLTKRFPQLANVDVEGLPGAKDDQVKQKILEDKLKRDVSKQVKSLREFFGLKSFSFSGLVKSWQDRLQLLEREYRRLRNRDLKSEVKKSKALGDLLENAQTYIESEEYDKAEDLLIDALNFNEHSVEAYLLLAEVYKGKRELAHAKETLEYILTLTHNEDPKVFHSMAQLSRERGDLKEAEEEYLRSISLDANNYLYYLQLAEVYKGMEDNAKALEVAKKSLVLAPNNPKILDFLVEISIILRDKEQGLEYLDKLKEVNPENKKLASLREKLSAL